MEYQKAIFTELLEKNIKENYLQTLQDIAENMVTAISAYRIKRDLEDGKLFDSTVDMLVVMGQLVILLGDNAVSDSFVGRLDEIKTKLDDERK